MLARRLPGDAPASVGSRTTGAGRATPVAAPALEDGLEDEVAILHVEDHEATRDVVRQALRSHGIAVVSADGVAAAKDALAERSDVAGALVDLRLRDGSGLDLYDWLAIHRPALTQRVAFVSGGGAELSHQAAALGRPILEKPFELADLVHLAAEWEGALAD